MAAAETTVLLLHGLGAAGAVWHGVGAQLHGHGVRTCCPDLTGHGSAPGASRYSLQGMARQALTALRPGADWIVCGHSLGGYVALELAGGGYGSTPRAALSLGARVAFTDEDHARAAQAAARPVRWFASHGEARERYARVAGLAADVDPAYLAHGVVAGESGYRLAQDPAVMAIRVPAFESLVRAARCPVLVARGAADPMVSRAQCDGLGARYAELPGLGHNAHVEDPAAVAALILGLLA